jgi:thiol-disulfide isomerase/thioredoxin
MALHQVDANYTILYFWDSNCGHCKKETPRIEGIYSRFKDKGVKVFAMNLDSDSQSWQKAIEEYQVRHWINVTDPHNESTFREKYDVFATPIIFLLDKEKRIIAKRIDAQILERFMENEIESKSAM